MKHFIAPLALAAAALVPTLAHAGLDNETPVHPLLGIALTAGGDKLSSVDYTNGYSQDITAGGLVYLYGGVELHQPGSPFSFQGTIGYHVDNASAYNGHQTFSRVPLEAIAVYHVAPKFRIGAGVRYASDAKFRSGGDASIGNADFDSQLGLVVMGEWLITPSAGLQLRYVNEQYKAHGVDASTGQPVEATIDGSHVGIGFNYYF